MLYKICNLESWTSYVLQFKGGYMKNKLLRFACSALFALIFSLIPCFSSVFNIKSNEVQTRTIEYVTDVSFENLYQRLTDQCDDVSFEYDESLNVFELKATQTIPASMLAEIDNVSIAEVEDVKLTYDVQYDPQTNLIMLIVYLNGELSDTLIGVPYTTDDGRLDAVFCVENELVRLSELQDLGYVQNCGWFSRILKKCSTNFLYAAAAVAGAAVVVGIAAIAAPVIAGAVGSVLVAVGGNALAMSAATAAGAAISTACAVASATSFGVAAALAVTAGLMATTAAVADIIENASGSYTFGDVYQIGEEFDDDKTESIVKGIALTASIVTLREMSRKYHIAFAVSKGFTLDNTNYAIGDLYISKLSLTFDEAYVCLIKSGMVNAITDLTSNNEIIKVISEVAVGKEQQELIDLLIKLKKDGFFSYKVQGIYTETVEAAATLAVLTGAWIKDKGKGLVGRGGVNGYNHFHDINKKIHIWYGDKIIEPRDL